MSLRVVVLGVGRDDAGAGPIRGRNIRNSVAQAARIGGETPRVAFGNTLTLRPRISLDATGGLDACRADCIQHESPTTIASLVARFRVSSDTANLVFDPSPAHTNPSMVGGYVRLERADTGGRRRQLRRYPLGRPAQLERPQSSRGHSP